MLAPGGIWEQKITLCIIIECKPYDKISKHFLLTQARLIYLNNKVRTVSVAIFKEMLPGMPNRMIIQTRMDRVKRIWYLSPMRAAKVQASLRIRAVSPEPLLLAHTSSESRGTFAQKTRSLAPLNGWACAVKMCHDGMLEDTNSLVAAQLYRHV